MNRPDQNPDSPDEGLELAVMRVVADSPTASQRSLALALGISLGKTNFLLRELLKKGLVKAENFRRSDNKLAYLYLLTPSGVVAKARLTQVYLQRKEAEYERLQQEIALLRSEVHRHGLPSAAKAEEHP
jgi:EPS-associated MarR family transcriptional regulator